MDNDQDKQAVQVEISPEVLSRLLRDGSLVASEVHYLNARSFRAGWRALKRAVLPR